MVAERKLVPDGHLEQPAVDRVPKNLVEDGQVQAVHLKGLVFPDGKPGHERRRNRDSDPKNCPFSSHDIILTQKQTPTSLYKQTWGLAHAGCRRIRQGARILWAGLSRSARH